MLKMTGFLNLLMVAILAWTGEGTASELAEKIDAAVASVKPAVVRIRVVSTECEDGRQRKGEATGSGVIISKKGYVITNHHVAGQARQIFCTLTNKEELEAELVGTDPLTDICVVKLICGEERAFPAAKLGDSSKVRVGSYCLAMGSPLALSQSVTLGVVSNTQLIFPELFWPFKFMVEGEEVGSMVTWIGHDANIYYGSSGGPLVNLDGEVIGINELWLGLGAAIPSNLVREVAEKIINYGDVQRSWLGLEVQPLLKSSKMEAGVLINNVIDSSPAQDSGFMAGDILLELAGNPVTIQFPEQLSDFNHLLTGLQVGEEIEAAVLRN
ncbi:trypsin-like peptidase domain-containing protein, partial [bacterium]|nr:trypsin-like peptidase domain-containing protein [bacterium]